ncbi:MAG TPA: excinuclease ABC subunit UvrC [Anaerovoracaceae bacterium]|nr:excinuclease ABC subunit UvrC [Anaerovoracaceae bacterium]
MFDIKENLKKLPDKPGVYLHKDKEGQIIYVGKAISLKNRIRQYFQARSSLEPKARAMVTHIAEFEYIITETEMEALILESNLIKKHMPKYNVLLRDDKSFPYIKVTIKEPWPRLVKVRRIEQDGSLYFGPYTDAGALTVLIDLLSDIFNLKRCSTVNFPDGFKPCLNYHIEKCRGICSGEVKNWEYRRSIDQAVDFLSGNTKDILKYLNTKMVEASEALEYEKAAEYRDQIAAANAIPDQERLDNFLSDIRRNKVKVIRRKAEEIKRKEAEKIKALNEDWAGIGLTGCRRVEAYDISHIAGTDAVGAMVVFEDGKKQKKGYRRFRIKTAPGGGDTDSLREVLYRRLKNGLDGLPGFLPMPDLLLIDGGVNQVNAVKQVMNALKLNIPVAGMVKNEKHRLRGLLYEDEEKDLKDRKNLMRYITVISDEVHRFAIDYHRGLRAKKVRKSVLDDIPGIGEKRKAALLKELGSIKAIKDADIETLKNIPGMNEKVAENVKKHLHNSIVKN